MTVNPLELITFHTKAAKAYEKLCQPLCKKYHLNQTCMDVLMFLSNNPAYNTARDLCEVRGIRSGNASVAIDTLVRQDFLTRHPDSSDRRITRLSLTETAVPLITEGKLIQKQYARLLADTISEDELNNYFLVAGKFLENIEKILADTCDS